MREREKERGGSEEREKRERGEREEGERRKRRGREEREKGRKETEKRAKGEREEGERREHPRQLTFNEGHQIDLHHVLPLALGGPFRKADPRIVDPHVNSPKLFHWMDARGRHGPSISNAPHWPPHHVSEDKICMRSSCGFQLSRSCRGQFTCSLQH